MNNRAQFSSDRKKASLKKKAKGAPYKDDVIYGPLGQLANPWKVTKIPGNTMSTSGYGNIPLWTVPDVGPPRMVMPNSGTQYFPGASYFTEYPVQASEGGWLDTYQSKGEVKVPPTIKDSVEHQAYRTLLYERGDPNDPNTGGGFDKNTKLAYGLSNWGYNQSQTPRDTRQFLAPNTLQEAAKRYMGEVDTRTAPYFDKALLRGQANDFLYNTGRDIRPYIVDQLYKEKYGKPEGIPNRPQYNVDTKKDKFTPQLANKIDSLWNANKPNWDKLSYDQQQSLMGLARQSYGQSIERGKGSINENLDAYKQTWYGRIPNLNSANYDAPILWKKKEYGGQPPVIDRLGRVHYGNSGYIPEKQGGGWLDTLPKAQNAGQVELTAEEQSLYTTYKNRILNPNTAARAEERLFELQKSRDKGEFKLLPDHIRKQAELELDALEEGAREKASIPEQKYGGWLPKAQNGKNVLFVDPDTKEGRARMQAYRDSSDNYDWSNKTRHYVNTTGRSPKGDRLFLDEPGHPLPKPRRLSREGVIREELERYPNRRTREEINHDLSLLDYIKGGRRNRAESYLVWPKYSFPENLFYLAQYAKPKIEVRYKESEPKVEPKIEPKPEPKPQYQPGYYHFKDSAHAPYWQYDPTNLRQYTKSMPPGFWPVTQTQYEGMKSQGKPFYEQKYGGSNWLDTYQPGGGVLSPVGGYQYKYETAQPSDKATPKKLPKKSVVEQAIEEDREMARRALPMNVRGEAPAEYVPIEMALMPATLPVRGASLLGRAGKFALEALNPVGGFRSGIPKSLQARDVVEDLSRLGPFRSISDNYGTRVFEGKLPWRSGDIYDQFTGWYNFPVTAYANPYIKFLRENPEALKSVMKGLSNRETRKNLSYLGIGAAEEFPIHPSLLNEFPDKFRGIFNKDYPYATDLNIRKNKLGGPTSWLDTYQGDKQGSQTKESNYTVDPVTNEIIYKHDFGKPSNTQYYPKGSYYRVDPVTNEIIYTGPKTTPKQTPETPPKTLVKPDSNVSPNYVWNIPSDRSYGPPPSPVAPTTSITPTPTKPANIDSYMWANSSTLPNVSFNTSKEYSTDLEGTNKYLEQDITQNEKNIQDVFYKLGDPSIENKDDLKQELKDLLTKRKENINKINKIREIKAGPFDTYIAEHAPAEVSKVLQKLDWADEPLKRSSELPKFETFATKSAREKEEYLTSKRFEDLDISKHPWERWRMRASASNSEPLEIALYGTRGERGSKPINIKAKGTLLHFLDQSPQTGYIHPLTKNIYNRLSPDEYIGKLENTDRGTKLLKYIKRKDFKGDITKDSFVVRQMPFDQIDFNKKVNDDNFPNHFYWTDKRTGKRAIPISSSTDENIYNYSSGQSVAYIFPYKGETRYIHFSGSPAEIRAEGNRIKDDYKLGEDKLIIGLADAGSYASNIRGNITNELLNSRDYGYFNLSGNTGAGAALVDDFGLEEQSKSPLPVEQNISNKVTKKLATSNKPKLKNFEFAEWFNTNVPEEVRNTPEGQKILAEYMAGKKKRYGGSSWLNEYNP